MKETTYLRMCSAYTETEGTLVYRFRSRDGPRTRNLSPVPSLARFFVV